jgi:lysyl-tRNA synthetase class 2
MSPTGFWIGVHAMTADFRPTASWANLRLRADLLKRTRRFFEARGFLEVETPLLSRDTVVDRHLDPLPVKLFDDAHEPQRGERFWLQTSPEFAMKRLLAAGAPSIYQITRAFRGGERGALHNPEFTMLEWYGVGHDYEAGRQFLSQLAEHLLVRGPAEQITYRDAFLRFARVDPLTASFDDLRLALDKAVPDNLASSLAEDSQDVDLLRDYLLTQVVEPKLGQGRPAIVHDYPSSQAALAQIRQDVVPIAERFELYVDGIELANGYHELLDVHVLRDRNRENNDLRRRDGKYTLPEESRLISAMNCGLPKCAGCALGFDRLVMVAAGARSINEALAFPCDRA